MRRKNMYNSDSSAINCGRPPSPLVSMSGNEQLTTSSNQSDNGAASALTFLTADVGNRHFRDENRKYCRSYSEKFFGEISQLSCANDCGAPSFDHRKLPMIAFCGHFIHKDCDKLRNRYYCKICDKSVEESDKNKPLRDAVLSNFFEARNDIGYQCPSGKTHAYTNIVNFPKCENDGFYCVWCVAKNKEKKNTFQNYSASVMSHTRAELLFLTTLDRFANVSGWALDVCCICRDVLREKKDIEIICLPCGHIGHNECPAREKESKVKCLLCKEDKWPVDRNNLPMRKWHGKLHLKGYTIEEYTQCINCQQFHPDCNLGEKTPAKCVWCTVKGFGPTEPTLSDEQSDEESSCE